MKKEILDGWHTIAGYTVYVENGKVVRGILKDRNGGEVAAYPYRAVKDGWTQDTYSTPDAFRAAVGRGTMKLH